MNVEDAEFITGIPNKLEDCDPTDKYQDSKACHFYAEQMTGIKALFFVAIAFWSFFFTIQVALIASHEGSSSSSLWGKIQGYIDCVL